LKKYKIYIQNHAQNVYFLKHWGHLYEFLTVQNLWSKQGPKVTFQHIYQGSWMTCYARIFYPKLDYKMIELMI